MIEAQIITRLRNRDKAALSDLYDHYAPAFYGQALRILDSEVLAQEAVQDTFLKIWNYFHLYDESKGKLFTWMYRIARNEAIDKKKNQNSKAAEKTVSLSGEVYEKEISTSSRIKIEDIGVRQLLDMLDDDTKGILDLVYFQGYSHNEVAEMMETPLGTIKTKVRRAILKLRSVLVKE